MNNTTTNGNTTGVGGGGGGGGGIGNPLDQALASLGVGLDGGAGVRCPPGKLDCVDTYKIDAQVYAR